MTLEHGASSWQTGKGGTYTNGLELALLVPLQSTKIQKFLHRPEEC